MAQTLEKTNQKERLMPVLQLRQESQKLRIRFSNRLSAIERGTDEPADDIVIDENDELERTHRSAV